MNHIEVAIAGGGIIGLSALELADAGLKAISAAGWFATVSVHTAANDNAGRTAL